MSAIRNSFRRRNRNSRKDNGELSPKELEADNIRAIIVGLRSGSKSLKKLHWSWENDKTREKVEIDYRRTAETVVRRSEELCKILKITPKDKINELARQIDEKDYQINQLKKKLDEQKKTTDKLRKSIPKELVTDELKFLREENMSLKRKFELYENYESSDDAKRPRQGEFSRPSSGRRARRGKHPSVTSQDGDIVEKSPGKRSLRNEDVRKEPSRHEETPITVEQVQVVMANVPEKSDHILQLELAKLKDSEKTLKDLVESLKQENRVLSKEAHDMKNEKSSLQSDLRKERENGSYLKKSVQSLSLKEEQFRSTIDKLNLTVEQERKAKDSALTRLSAVAGNKIRDNNPGITDLSDPNRPMKLAEKISELYDNEWTNSIENLEYLNKSEEEGITILLKIITEIFNCCDELSSRQRDNIDNIGFHLTVPDIDDLVEKASAIKGNFPKLPIEVTKPLKDYRKMHCEEVFPFLYPILLNKLKLSLGYGDEVLDACDEYIKNCIKYMWIMCAQDPPVFMDCNYGHGDEFDSNKLRSYTKSGKSIEYMVWPVLYLHKDGPLLAKGVAQGLKITK